MCVVVQAYRVVGHWNRQLYPYGRIRAVTTDPEDIPSIHGAAAGQPVRRQARALVFARGRYVQPAKWKCSPKCVPVVAREATPQS